MRPRARHIGKFVIIVVALFALGEVVMLLWNAVAPALIAGAHQIDYWHALGLLALCRILVGGFRGHHGHHGGHEHWQKWQSMTAEEREQIIKGRFRHHGRKTGE